MKRIVWFVVLIFALGLATTALAKGNDPVGDRIGIFFDGNQEFPANQPFHIRHGFINELGAEAAYTAGDGFELEVDGVPVRHAFQLVTIDTSTDPKTKTVLWLYNFPEGMTGVHTFTGHWFAACADVAEDPSTCLTPTTPVETRTTTVEVTFTE